MKKTTRILRWMATLALGLTVMTAQAADRTRTGHREGIERNFSGGVCPVTSTNQAGRSPKPKWHSVVMLPKTNEPPVHWYNKINPVWWFGNLEEPTPPAWYEPGSPHRNRDWYFRNPFTNLSYYVIGVADKRTVRSGRYPTLVGNPHGGWNFAVTRRRIVLLPFVDYKNRHLEFYFGWRERGNFGMKLNFHHPPEKSPP